MLTKASQKMIYKMKPNSILCLLSFLLVTTASAYAQSPITPGRWIDQKGSILMIEQITEGGKISGYYLNQDDTWGCKGIRFPVTGWAYGNVAAFSANWKPGVEFCPYLVNWTGIYLLQEDPHGKKGLVTQWYLAMDGSEESTDLVKGQSVFTREK